MNVMLTYWDKLFGYLMITASQKKDSYVKEILTQVARVQPEIKKALFQFYIKRCQELYAIAFFQWRYEFEETSKYENKVELEKIIVKRMSNFFKPINKKHKVPKSTMAIASLSPNFAKNYKLVEMKKVENKKSKKP